MLPARSATQDLHDLEMSVCPTCGSCSGMYTANTMNCLTEALGMALPGSGTIPAVFADRRRLARRTGEAVVRLLQEGKTAAPDPDAGGHPQRPACGHGPGRLDQYDPASAGHRPGSRL